MSIKLSSSYCDVLNSSLFKPLVLNEDGEKKEEIVVLQMSVKEIIGEDKREKCSILGVSKGFEEKCDSEKHQKAEDKCVDNNCEVIGNKDKILEHKSDVVLEIRETKEPVQHDNPDDCSNLKLSNITEEKSNRQNQIIKDFSDAGDDTKRSICSFDSSLIGHSNKCLNEQNKEFFLNQNCTDIENSNYINDVNQAFEITNVPDNAKPLVVVISDDEANAADCVILEGLFFISCD